MNFILKSLSSLKSGSRGFCRRKGGKTEKAAAVLGRRHETFDLDDHDDDQDDDDHYHDHDHDDYCRVDKDKLRARAVAGGCGNARRRRITRLAVIIIFAMVIIIFIVIFMIVILSKTFIEMTKTQVLPWSEHHAASPSFPLMGEQFSITI